MSPATSYSAKILLAALCSIFSGCSKTLELADFTSDGCSLFPDRSLIDAKDWCECCVEHDVAYWQGGTEAQRLAADETLRDCVLAKTDDPILADVMYNGVRFGGSPYFYNWYRWGYGWNDHRKYQELTLEEQRMVSEKLVAYYQSNPVSPCDSAE
ncbi:MAG: hypothetical protein ACI9ZV_000851 [Candidatus Azotimanducaceae bacterium]|jgi:hypothetical protein